MRRHYGGGTARWCGYVVGLWLAVAHCGVAASNDEGSSAERGATERSSTEMFVSNAFGRGSGVPSLVIEEREPSLKWFDDQPRVRSGDRLELGVASRTTGLGVGLRARTFYGHHTGAASAYECLLSLCGWVSGGLANNNQVKDEVRYQVSTYQVWIKKDVKFDNTSVGMKVGISYVNLNADLDSTFRTLRIRNEVILPLVGLQARYMVNDRWDIAGDVSYVAISYGGVAAKVIDADFELGVWLSQWLRIAVGHNSALLKLTARSNSADAALVIPQRGPYVRVVVTY